MPVILLIEGFKFKFYSNENTEPPHIHVTKAEGNAKFWLIPEVYSYGYTVRERRRIQEIVIANQSLFIQKWHEYFGI